MTTKFSIDELLLFHEVLQAGSLTKASERRQMAKSTVSRRLASLEKEIGALLLKRNSRKILPTEVGQKLYVRCEKIVNEIAALSEIVSDSRDEIRGTLRVSIPSEFGSGWLGKAISEFALQYPDLELDIQIATAPVNLLEEPYDVAINFGLLKDSRLVCKRIATLPRGIYASPSYLAEHGKPTRLTELSDHPFVVTDVQQREGTLVLTDQQTRRKIKVRHRIKVNSMRLARELVLGGVGLAVLPRAMSSAYVRRGLLEAVLPNWECPPVQATAVVLARDGIPRKTRVFLDFVAKRLQSIEGDG